YHMSTSFVTTPDSKNGQYAPSPFPHLTDAHYHQLSADSAISDDIIQESGCRSLSTKEAPATLKELGFSAGQCKLGAGLLLRLTPPGESESLYESKPDPPAEQDGKKLKSEIPAGAKQRLILHPSITASLEDPKADLYVTEGAKKAYALQSHGCNAIGLIGVW